MGVCCCLNKGQFSFHQVCFKSGSISLLIMTKKYVVGSSCVFLLSNNEKKVENLVTRKILFKMVSVSAESRLYKVVDSKPEVSSSTAHFYSEPHFCTV